MKKSGVSEGVSRSKLLASRGQHLLDGQISHLSTCPRLPPEPHGSHDRHIDMTVTWAPVLGCLLRTRGQLHWTSVQVIDTCETVRYDQNTEV